jgi:hypothetical protein
MPIVTMQVTREGPSRYHASPTVPASELLR